MFLFWSLTSAEWWAVLSLPLAFLSYSCCQQAWVPLLEVGWLMYFISWCWFGCNYCACVVSLCLLAEAFVWQHAGLSWHCQRKGDWYRQERKTRTSPPIAHHLRFRLATPTHVPTAYGDKCMLQQAPSSKKSYYSSGYGLGLKVCFSLNLDSTN